MAALTIQQAFELALQHHQAGRLRDAEQLYRQILTQQPAHAGALHYLGMIAHQAGGNEVAVDLIRQAIALRPGYADAHNNLGIALKAKGQLDEAIAAYRQAITLRSGYAEAHCNLGNALKDKGQPTEAIACYQRAISFRPGYAEAYGNLGNALQDQGQLDEAIAAHRQAIILRPNHAGAYYNLGIALEGKGQFDEAIASYRHAIALRPTLVDAHNNLGNVLKERGQLDEAVAAYRQAIALRLGFAEAYNNLGTALKDTGQFDDAIAAIRRALALRPSYAEAHSNLLLDLNYHPGFDARAIAVELGRWNLQHAEPLKKFIQPHSTGSGQAHSTGSGQAHSTGSTRLSSSRSGQAHANDRDPERRLRIGYVSADFWWHASAFFLLPLLEHHDPQQVEIICYAQDLRPDATTSRMQQHVSQWHNTADLSDEQLAAQIREDRIDILVDLKLHTGSNRLPVFARKPSPVQVTWLGYPGSTGLDTIDYRLSDPYLDPPGMDESVYTEQTLRLPDSFWCYDPLDGREISVNSLPALDAGIITFGSLNAFCKINQEVLELWAQVLRQVEGSRLILLASPGNHRQRTAEFLAQQGVDPKRLEFLDRRSRKQYLELYHRIDLGLVCCRA